MTFAVLNDMFSAKNLASVILLSSALYASSGMAQELSAAGATAPANAGAQQSSATTSADQQQPAPQARVQKFDDWYYRCVDGKAPDGSATTSCEVAQIATVKQGEQDVNILTLAIAKAPAPAQASSPKKGSKTVQSDLVLTALVPLNMYLPAGLSIDASDKPVIQLAYRNCNQAGCWSQQKLDAKMVAALSKAADGVGHVQMMNGQKVNIKFSLKGLASALDALQKPASN
ncbi:invasion associated locus B family protein (plasmid) [Rhizobium sp. CB3090]|uniref:invasion associated locus B family protein n=1 Tax=Rhizobium sp. CB3090 TaxID=3039156 RepID=UPI0024B0FE61|nr:invasion associated locus B family protein [Rhizobium sp. CB3090]WFU12154.1 invasion associated locus B family protein [Rhizobium sp. CB3090]